MFRSLSVDLYVDSIEEIIGSKIRKIKTRRIKPFPDRKSEEVVRYESDKMTIIMHHPGSHFGLCVSPRFIRLRVPDYNKESVLSLLRSLVRESQGPSISTIFSEWSNEDQKALYRKQVSLFMNCRDRETVFVFYEPIHYSSRLRSFKGLYLIDVKGKMRELITPFGVIRNTVEIPDNDLMFKFLSSLDNVTPLSDVTKEVQFGPVTYADGTKINGPYINHYFEEEDYRVFFLTFGMKQNEHWICKNAIIDPSLLRQTNFPSPSSTNSSGDDKRPLTVK